MPDRRELDLIDPEDVKQLQQRHRDAMLDLILAWGSLDGALGMMLARVMGIPMVEGAELVSGMPATARFAHMRRLLLKSATGADAAAMLKKHKKSYEQLAPMRNMIAHSHCAGFWTKYPDYVVFLTYQKVGDDALAVDGMHIGGMQRATAWAHTMRKLAFEVSNVPYDPD